MDEVTNLAVEELKKRVATAGSRAAAARELGIDPAQLSDVLNGRRDISKGMLEKMGFTRVIVYTRKQDKPKVVRAIEETVVTFRPKSRLVDN